ncbi:MAG: cytochrome C biogenesis protein, partial [Rhodospirillales bacterium]|nr:cytochrome C biogenesis protein [Rhodospirillales bacterium]
MAIRRIWLAGLALLAAVAPPAWGAQSDSVTSARAAATLVSESDAVAPGQPVRVGLRLRMAPGWHTYWKNPGDAGAAPSLAFRLPAGVTAGPIRWPAPSRNAEGPLMTYGYAGDLLLPVTLRGAAGALAVHLHATWLVCQNICVPEQGDFTLELPAGTPAPSAQAGLFAAADAAMPRPAPWSARIAPDGVLTLSGPGLSPAAVRAAWFIPDGDTLANAAPQTMTAAPDRLALQL